MTTDNQGFPINEIISEVTLEIGDSSFRFFSYGWYLARGRDALSELGIDTKYFILPIDLEIPKELAIKVPAGVFNIKDIFLWNGSCFTQDKCQNVFFKSGFTRRIFVNGTEFQKSKALDVDNESDDFFSPQVISSDTRYYVGLQNNHLVLSDSCSQFQYIRIIANIIPVAPGEEYGVPEIWRKAIKLYIAEVAAKALKVRDPNKFRPIWRDYYDELYTPINGAWDNAKKRAKNLNTKQRNDLNLINQ